MVDECTHEGHRCLLALRGHSREPQGPVILQAVPRGVEGVPLGRWGPWQRLRYLLATTVLRPLPLVTLTHFRGLRAMGHGNGVGPPPQHPPPYSGRDLGG